MSWYYQGNYLSLLIFQLADRASCLFYFKYICRAGRPEFKREMAKKVDAIKECLRKLQFHYPFFSCIDGSFH
jgi:hypothetical protein